ncbi:MAG TPA: hypothetical protein VGH72_33825 [Pseudonocardia sp.]
MTTREDLAATAREHGWTPLRVSWWRSDRWSRGAEQVIVIFTDSGRVSQASLLRDRIQTEAVYATNRSYSDKVAKVSSWLTN